MGEGLVVEWPGGRRLLEALVFWSRGIRSHLGAIRKGGLENPAVSKKGAGEQGVLCSVALEKQPFSTEGLASGGCGGRVRGHTGPGISGWLPLSGMGFGVEARAGVYKCNPIQTSPNPKARPKPGRNRRPFPPPESPRSPLRHKRPPAL